MDAVKNMVMKHIEGNCLILLTIVSRSHDDLDSGRSCTNMTRRL